MEIAMQVMNDGDSETRVKIATLVALIAARELENGIDAVMASIHEMSPDTKVANLAAFILADAIKR